MMKVKHLFFAYEKWGDFVLRDISFSAQPGEIIGVLGANGAGKTTLLKTLAGILPPNTNIEEKILWDGVPIREKKGEIAYITEAGSFLKDLTPLEYGRFLEDFISSFDMAYYEKLLRFFQLEEKPIKKMSKGQKAKAEVAAGMAKKAKLILMDEPFLGKDLFTRQDFMQAFAGSLSGEELIFLTTHEIDEIENFIDRALILKEGKLAVDVEMDTLRESGQTLKSLMKEIMGYEADHFKELLE